MRTYGANNIWSTYTGEGAAGTTVVSASAARNGSNGLRMPLSAGTAYMQFYPNNGSVWSFANERLLSGTWQNDRFNRLGFWVKHPSTMAAATGNTHNIEFGSYVRAQAGDPATQNDGGTHYYHYYNVLPDVWTYVIVDWHPQHYVGGPTSDPGAVQYPTTTGAGWNYFDSLTRLYWNAPYISPSGYPANFDFDDFKFFYDTNANEDIANIASLEASYNAATDLLHVGFCRNSADDTTYTAKYATTDIWALGFASATTLGTSGVDGLGDYVNKKIEGTVDLGAATEVFIAVQKQGATYFRQIRLPLV